ERRTLVAVEQQEERADAVVDVAPAALGLLVAESLLVPHAPHVAEPRLDRVAQPRDLQAGRVDRGQRDEAPADDRKIRSGVFRPVAPSAVTARLPVDGPLPGRGLS